MGVINHYLFTNNKIIIMKSCNRALKTKSKRILNISKSVFGKKNLYLSQYYVYMLVVITPLRAIGPLKWPMKC